VPPPPVFFLKIGYIGICTGVLMTAVKAYYDGSVFVPKGPVYAEVNQEVIVTLPDSQHPVISQKEQLLNLAGSISHDDYLEMEKILEDTEKIDPNEW